MDDTEDIGGRAEHLDADLDDIADLLKRIEKSYNIIFEKDELKPVRTFGELCDIIITKIKLIDSNDCTRQQVFYKLRKAFISILEIDISEVKAGTELASLFPQKMRRNKITELEKELGFRLKILYPPPILNLSGVAFLLISFLTFFYKWEYAIIGIASTIIFFVIIFKTGNVLRVRTVGNLVEKITWEHYLKGRRNPKTANKKEIVREIEKMFLKKLVTDLKEIKPETIIV